MLDLNIDFFFFFEMGVELGPLLPKTASASAASPFRFLEMKGMLVFFFQTTFFTKKLFNKALQNYTAISLNPHY